MPLDQSFSRSAHASRTRSTKSASRAISPEIVNVNREVTGDVLASVLGFQSAYSDLRRLVGLVAGMLLLSQTSGKSNAMDWSTLAGARETWNEAETRIQGLKPTPSVERNLHHLERAHQLIGNCLDVLRSPRKIANEMGLQAALRNVAESYRHLQYASLPGLGITMVDFSHACCGGHCQSELRSDGLGGK
jgi:hypothetical protein